MNSKLKKLISIPKSEATNEDDDRLVEQLKKAQLIMPIDITSNTFDDNFEFKPITLADEDGNILIPLFSDDDELVKSEFEFNVVNIASENLAEMISETNEYYGIVINPFSKYSLIIPLNQFIELF